MLDYVSNKPVSAFMGLRGIKKKNSKTKDSKLAAPLSNLLKSLYFIQNPFDDT